MVRKFVFFLVVIITLCPASLTVVVCNSEARVYCPRPAEMFYTTNGVDPIICAPRTPTTLKPACPI